jgi:protein-tyrosine-phosphatase
MTMRSPDPSSHRTVLVVCFGNLCRSPVAEALFRAALPREGWRVVSAGTHAIGDDPPTAGAREALLRHAGIDIAQQRSKPLTVDLLRDADFVFTMSRRQALEAAALYPGAARMTRLLGAFAPAEEHGDGPADPGGRSADGHEIADPMGGNAAVYTTCCKRVDECVAKVTAWLLSGAEPEDAPPSVAAWTERP